MNNHIESIPAVRARDISKQYQLGGAERQHDSFRELLTNLFKAPFQKIKILSGREHAEQQLFYALKDINFDIPEGQITAVIGRNGAGKSTLLKVLSRITSPTSGEVQIRGRVASLLEVGSGFHPELTGRENIYMNASVLGMRRHEVDQKLDEIVAFAEVERFLDTPVKRYSSGMYVRLAFSVAAHVDPDVLLIDEVLAVGDAKFQQRCIGKLSEVSKAGRTVLFVSHNMGLVQDLCSHSIYLKEGMIQNYGRTDEVLPEYLRDGSDQSNYWHAEDSNSCIRKVELLDLQTQSISSTAYDKSIRVRMNIIPDRKDTDFVLAVRVSDQLGRDVFTSWDTDSIKRQTIVGEQSILECHLPSQLMRPGHYYLTIMMRNSKHGYIDYIEEAALQFEVSNIGFPMNEDRFGVVLPTLQWNEAKCNDD